MKTKEIIPNTVKRFARILKEQGYSKKNPFCPKRPFRLKQTIDMPGVLDFAYADFVSFWPEKGILYGKYKEPGRDVLTEIKVADFFRAFGDGNYVDSWWDTDMLKTLCDEFEKPVCEFVYDLSPLYESVCRFISEHQGDKGYIDTQSDDYDPIQSIEWNQDLELDVGMRIHGIRVVNDDLQVVSEMPHCGCSVPVVYGDEDFRNPDTDWKSVRYGEDIQYEATLLNIVEFIKEYYI